LNLIFEKNDKNKKKKKPGEVADFITFYFSNSDLEWFYLQ